MNKQTGAIAWFETDEDANRAGYHQKLTPAQAKQFHGMNRKERRAEGRRLARQEKRDKLEGTRK